MYQVGFGDCFLLSFHYRSALADGRKERHILIDFGSTHGPRKPVKELLEKAAALIERHCGANGGPGKLDVLVATHRHRDHLSGFGDVDTAAVIDRLNPELVVRPWTEDPKLPADATAVSPRASSSRRYAASLGEAQNFAEQVVKAVATEERFARGLADDVVELAREQLPNREAIERLNGWAKKGAGEYLHAGMTTAIEQLVPGVKVRVLGPPTVEQAPGVVRQRANHPEYWLTQRAMLAGDAVPLAALRELTAVARDTGMSAEAAGRASAPAGLVRWLVERMERQHLASLYRIVHTLDDALNNTSVILLIEAGDKRLLFPGDAQIENWWYALNDAPDCDEVRKLLAQVDLYKVGHHGSRNATPRNALFNLWGADPDPARPMVALMSTRGGVHGRSEATAVPRATLVAALERRTTLYSTDDPNLKQPYVEVSARLSGGHPFERVEPDEE